MTTIYTTFINDHFYLFANKNDAISCILDELLDYLNEFFNFSSVETDAFLRNEEYRLRCGHSIRLFTDLDNDDFFATITKAPLIE